MTFGGAADPADPSGQFQGRAWLRSGLQLPLRIVGGDDKSLDVDTPFGAALALPWIRMHAVLTAELSGDDRALFDSALAAPLDTQDILLARDRQSGKLTRLSLHVLGIAGEDLRVDFRGERSVPLTQVAAIVFGKESGAAAPALPLPTVALHGRGDARDAVETGGRLLSLDAKVLRVQIPDGPTLAIPVAALGGLEVRSSRIAWLSAMEPSAVERTAALDTPPLLLRDAAPGGEGLVLGTHRYARGLCAVPRTRVSFALEPGAFDHFETTIGIDERSTGPADAVFRVLLDGKVAWQLEHVHRGTAETVRVPLGDARTLSLEVDFGDNFDLGDHCVFAAARLLKS